MSKLEFLLGFWKGTGKGFLPEGRSFEFDEDLEISSIGQPNFMCIALSNIGGKPLHREAGFIKCSTDGSVGCSMADNLGVTYLLVGEVTVDNPSASVLCLMSKTIASLPFNKKPRVNQVVRKYMRLGDELHYTFQMSTSTSQQLQDHLHVKYYLVSK